MIRSTCNINWLFFLFILITFESCDDLSNSEINYSPVFVNDSASSNTLVFGFPSFFYSQSAEPLISYFNQQLSGVHIKIKACVSFEEYLENLRNKKFDITLVNGIIAMQSDGYSIAGKISGDDNYRGVVFVRKDAGILTMKDLTGKSISLVSSNVIPGTMMPLYFLYQNGIDVNRNIRRIPVSSFESVIINTYLGKSDAGICLSRNWNVYIKDHPEILNKVEEKWETPALVNNALLLKKTISDSTKIRLLQLLFALEKSVAGKSALDKLGIRGFEAANEQTYKPMMDFKKKYDSVIL